MKKILLIPLLLFSTFLYAQDSLSIAGKVMDKETNEPLPFVNIVIEKDGVQIDGYVSDFDGNYVICGLSEGMYDLKVSSVGFSPLMLTGIKLGKEKKRTVDIKMKSVAIQFSCFCCCYICRPPTPEPIVDLFAEQDSLSAAMDTTLSSSSMMDSVPLQMVAFPNPSSGMFSLKNIPETGEMVVLDLSGKTIKTLMAKKGEMVTIDLSSHPPGTFLVKYQENGTMKVHQLVMY